MRQYGAVKRDRTPAIQYWLAYTDGAPRAYLSSWDGLNGIGMLEDLFTVSAYRHRGLATALLVHAAADVRARDKQVDRQNKALFEMGLQFIAADPRDAEVFVHKILLARNFERVGDHIVNIARHVHQIVTGEDLKASD